MKGKVIQIRSKTEQKVQAVIAALKKADEPLTYSDLRRLTGTSPDVLLYILAPLVEVGCVERIDVPEGPGRPKVRFSWIERSASRSNARALGARSA